jgi:hypothetical protein
MKSILKGSDDGVFRRLNKEQKPLGSVYIPYVKDVSKEFKRIENRYNIRTIFKTKHTLRSSLIKTSL